MLGTGVSAESVTDIRGLIRDIAERDDPSELVMLAALLERMQEILTWIRDRSIGGPQRTDEARLVYRIEPAGETTAAGQLQVVAALEIPSIWVRAQVATNARGELLVRSSFKHCAISHELIATKRAEIAALAHLVEAELGTGDVRDDGHGPHLDLLATKELHLEP